MINDKICELRDELNKKIVNGEDYNIIYKISVELDELIAEYYRESEKEKERIKKHIKLPL